MLHVFECVKRERKKENENGNEKTHSIELNELHECNTKAFANNVFADELILFNNLHVKKTSTLVNDSRYNNVYYTALHFLHCEKNSG
jgi:hypothetical protein